MRRRLAAFGLTILPLTAPTADTAGAEKKAIADMETRLCTAEKALDLDAIMALYVPDESLHVFDMLKPRQYIGWKAFRKDWETFLQNHAKSIDVCEVTELAVEVAGSLATSHYTQQVEFTDKSGVKGAANTRLTHIFKKIEGKWLIIHEHGSYPIDWKTGIADRLSTP